MGILMLNTEIAMCRVLNGENMLTLPKGVLKHVSDMVNKLVES